MIGFLTVNMKIDKITNFSQIRLKDCIGILDQKSAVIIRVVLTQADFSADSIESNTAIAIKKANEINMFVSVFKKKGNIILNIS